MEKLRNKKIRFYNIKINGVEIDKGEKCQLSSMILSEENIRSFNKTEGTDYHIRNTNDMNKLLKWYLEHYGDMETLEYETELI